MSNNRNLTPVEWEIMDAIWNLGDTPSVRDVMNRAYPNGEKAYTTIQTIMNTLEKKKYLKRRKIGMVNFYTPVRSRQQTVKTETSELVSRLFHDSLPAFADFLLDSDNISLEEIEQIKAMIEKKENELRSES
ncbi:BlaI/MecI/CopY family transcriptional regulator [bacterium]|nr:BlaI/MecI/CopY family transcriptional regulator [bacterium]